MTNINDLYSFLSFIVNQHGRGYLPIDDFNVVINQASDKRFNFYYSKGYPFDQNTMDVMRPFITPLTVLPVTNGTVAYPRDYVHLDALFTYPLVNVNSGAGADDLTPVEIVPYGKLGYRLTSTIVKPDAEFPIGVMYDNRIQLYPSTVSRVKMAYLRKPKKAKWVASQTSSRDEEVYDHTASIQVEWPESEHNDLILEAASLFGINLKSADIINYAAQHKQA